MLTLEREKNSFFQKVKTISKKKFETTLENLVFEELARVFMEQENQPSEKELKEIAARIMNSVNKILKSNERFAKNMLSVKCSKTIRDEIAAAIPIPNSP